MLRYWLLALPLALFLVLAPVAGQDAKKDDTKKDDTKKDDKKDDPKSSSDEADLKWGLKAGTTFFQKMVTKTEQQMTVSSNTVEQKQEQTFLFSWTPEKQEADGAWVIKQKIEVVIMKIDIGNQKIEYDSTKADNAGNNPLSEFFKSLVGSEFKITVKEESKENPRLKVTKIEGREDFVKKLTAANPQMKPLLEQILSEKAMIEMAEPTFAALPNAKKKKGDSWSKDTNLDMGPIGRYENTYRYTYEGKDDKEKELDKIKVETTLKYKEPGDTPGGATLPFKIKSADLKSTSASGTILYNPKLQRIEKTSMDLKLKGSLNIDIGGQPTVVDLNQTQTSVVETLEKNPYAEKPK